MGKIFNALEKYLKENEDPPDIEPLCDEDCDALLQYNQITQKLNINNGQVIRDPSIVDRLLVNKLILPDGKITPKGKKRYDELINQRRIAMAGQSPEKAKAADSDSPAPTDAAPEPLRDNDWGALMAYDRNTGHILRYDPETGQLEAASQAALIQAGIIQRLLAHELIIPGGKLTLKGIKECRRLEEQRPVESVVDVYSQMPDSRSAHPPEVEDDVEDRSKAPLREAFTARERFVWTTETNERHDAAKGAQRSQAGCKSPAEPSVIDPNLVSLLAPQSFMAERFKILRTNLLYPVGKDAPRSILVTSVNPGDGKSFVAANLAVSVAMNINRYVLLMDCDLRKPTIHTQFGFKDCQGLSEYLSKGVSLPSLLRQTKIERLTILPGGFPPPNPSELLSSNRMAKLMEEVTNRYPDRLIVIDSPPPSLTAETGVLAKLAEGVILVVRHQKTNEDDLKSLIHQMGKDKFVGSVLNYFDDPSIGTKGYRYYRKYGDYTYG